MSFETWMKEFYPVDARYVACALSEREAIAHSLQKFIGLRHENLARHDVKLNTDFSTKFVYDGCKKPTYLGTDGLYINVFSCSLCMRFMTPDGDTDCYKCPIVKSGNKGCNEMESAWDKFICSENPNPEVMIDVLQRTLKWYDKANGNQV
jgi:hypothetical protein